MVVDQFAAGLIEEAFMQLLGIVVVAHTDNGRPTHLVKQLGSRSSERREDQGYQSWRCVSLKIGY